MCKSKGDLRKDRRQDNRKHPLEPGSAMASVCTSQITHPGALATLSVWTCKAGDQIVAHGGFRKIDAARGWRLGSPSNILT